MWFAFTILGSVIVLSRAVPKCPELGEYTMQQDVKDHIVPKVLLHSPGKDITDVFSVYDCYLEKMAGEILKDPHKPIKFLESIGIYPLVYSMYVLQAVYSLLALVLTKDSLINVTLHRLVTERVRPT
ncbi:hypothetical protein Y032_0457g1803 [Ancylostoma ceylanicum]|uniref:Uncharacterized protein n=1 Tax=Ancylostoma ceylanicum TaxID=53326 RepID=A0A016WZ97_9BILA|nr:hypothetical protein Y032_0457g1803 [Ancylostoma ceylanicum]